MIVLPVPKGFGHVYERHLSDYLLLLPRNVLLAELDGLLRKDARRRPQHHLWNLRKRSVRYSRVGASGLLDLHYLRRKLLCLRASANGIHVLLRICLRNAKTAQRFDHDSLVPKERLCGGCLLLVLITVCLISPRWEFRICFLNCRLVWLMRCFFSDSLRDFFW